MARKRQFTTFSLSFLDVMSCGFGAVVLVFLMLDHAAEVHSQDFNRDLLSEVNFLDKEVTEGIRDLAELRNTIALVDHTIVEAQGRAAEIIEEIRRREEELADLDKDSLAYQEHLNRLKADIRSLEEELRRLQQEGERQQGEDVRRFLGEGDRQYLTGLKLGGRRVLILLDASASMLDRSLINIIRMRNMPAEAQRKAPKWQGSIAIVDWLTAQLPESSDYQVYLFNTDATAALPDTMGQWLSVSDQEQLESVVDATRNALPSGGTSLANVFSRIEALTPAPDNIYLITDGLPTQGKTPAMGGTVNGRSRLRHFTEAVRSLPRGVPVNVILAPMEGDPMAASAFWQLAQTTRGAFLAPSKDWP